MKKPLLKPILSLLVGLTLLATTAQAEDYDLWIAGTRVTSNNESEISGSGISGTVKYNPIFKTLFITNATINAEKSSHGIKSEISGLSIIFSGTSKITSINVSAIWSSQSFSMSGDRFTSLKVESTESTGITLDKWSGTLTIEGDFTVESKGKERGIYGKGTGSDKLIINGSTVKATGTDEGSITEFSALEGFSKLTRPALGYYDWAVKSGLLIMKNEVVIQPLIRIAGIGVNIDKAGYVDGFDKKVSFNNENKNLKINNADIKAGDGFNAIYSLVPNLTISLLGSNKVSSTDSPAIYAKKDLYISGPVGTSLTAISTKDAGIKIDDSSLHVEDGCTVIAKGANYGIFGSKASVLNVLNSIVKATGPGIASIAGFSELVLEYEGNTSRLTQPANARNFREGVSVVNDIMRIRV